MEIFHANSTYAFSQEDLAKAGLAGLLSLLVLVTYAQEPVNTGPVIFDNSVTPQPGEPGGGQLPDGIVTILRCPECEYCKIYLERLL